MRFLLDESVNAQIRPHLERLGHDVSAIAREHPASLADPEVLAIADRERRILITADRDFGEPVFVRLRTHAGVILLRLGSPPPLALTIARLDDLLAQHAGDLDQFVVVTPHLVRVRRQSSPASGDTV